MSAFSDTTIQDILKLYLNGTPIANIADNAASSPLVALFVALHTADPGGAGNQSTNEISYSPYARIGPTRDSSGWTITGNAVLPNADIAFAKPLSGVGQLATFGSIGFLSSGAGKIIFKGALVPPITIALGNAPRILRGSRFEIT